MAAISIILIGLAFIQLLIGLGILFESRRSRQLHQKLFVVLLGALFFWTLTSAVLIYVDAYATVGNIDYFNIVNRFSFVMGAVALVMLYLFGMAYPVRKPLTMIRKLLVAFGLAIAGLGSTSMVAGTFSMENGTLHYEYGLLSILLVVYAVAVLGTMAVDTTLLYRSSVDVGTKRQAVTVLTGLALTIVHAVSFLIILPLIFSTRPVFYSIGYLAPYIFTSFTAYGLLKQGLFNVRAVVARSVGYVASLAVLGALYLVVVFAISAIFFGQSITLKRQVIFAIVTAVLATLYQVIVPVFNKLTNKLFYRDAYDSSVLIEELNKILVSTIDSQELLGRSAALLASTLKAQSCVFIIALPNGRLSVIGTALRSFDDDVARTMHRLATGVSDDIIITNELSHSHATLRDILDEWNIDLTIRLVGTKHENDMTGYILLGEKMSGDMYSMQDVKVLTIVANELAIAIQNAMQFQEIKNFNVTLQDKVNDATRKLRRTNDKLKALDQTKDDFISMASHQLRTPLTSIKGYVSMVLDGDMGEINGAQRQALTQALVSSQRMVFLIADLLNLSRLKTGKFVIEATPTRLADIIESEVNQLLDTAKGRELELTYVKPAHFPTLMLDETKIRQVAMNFMDNAIYYTHPGGHITVELKETEKAVEFTVTDDGIGVPKAEQHHLFNKFYRAGNARKARPDGTGLGLFMAKKVIVAQGGSIIFRSSEGKGSTFGFTFAKARLQVPSHVSSAHAILGD